MTDSIKNPHDKLFKQLLGDPEHAASFLRANLPESLVRHLDLSTLEVIQASFIDSQYVQSEADLLLSVRMGGRPGFIYVLLEHQSSPDALILLRLLSYMVRVWRRYALSHPEVERLPVIVPMVVFHGPREWRGAVDFHSLVDMPSQEFAVFTPDFHLKLFNLSGPTSEALAGSAVVRIVSDLLGAMDKPDYPDRIRRAFETLNELAEAPNFARVFEVMFRYILDVYNIPRQDLMNMAVEAVKPDVREAVMTTYEQIKEEGRLEGRLEGKLEGKSEAAAEIALRLLAKRFKIDAARFEPMVNRLGFEQCEELSERILDAHSTDEILTWLQNLSHN